MAEPDQPTSQIPDNVTCPPTKEPSVKMFIITAMLLGFGAWCVYDLVMQKIPEGPSRAFNLVCAVVLPPVGIAALVYGIWLLTRTFVADQDGLAYNGQDKVAWANVRKLVLRGKGLLDIYFTQDGEEGMFKLDSYKMQNFAELVSLIEAKTPNVPTEAPGRG